MDGAQDENNLANNIAFKTLKHDIQNQLSNINLALEQLRYELPDVSAEVLFYLDTISTSCNTINSILKNKE